MAEAMAGVGPFARSPLADRAGDLAALGAVEVGFLAQVSLRADPELASARIGFALPSAPNSWTPTGGREALWLGPDEWLVVAEPGSATAIVEELERALEGLHHAVVDVSANRAVVELAGGDRMDLLARGAASTCIPAPGGRACARRPCSPASRCCSRNATTPPGCSSAPPSLTTWSTG